MNSKSIEKQIKKLTSQLIEVGLCVNQNYPSNKKSGGFNTVSFYGDKGISKALKNIPYTELYHELVDAKCYNMMFIDGGLAQLSYTIAKNTLISHRLCFFPSPDLETYKEAQEAYDMDYLYGNVVRDTIMPFPIRFDFDLDEKRYKEIYHSRTHMTLGEFDHCRIPVSSPLTPISFISFLLRHLYFEDRNPKVNDLIYASENQIFSETITANEKKVPHFTIV